MLEIAMEENRKIGIRKMFGIRGMGDKPEVLTKNNEVYCFITFSRLKRILFFIYLRYLIMQKSICQYWGKNGQVSDGIFAEICLKIQENIEICYYSIIHMLNIYC